MTLPTPAELDTALDNLYTDALNGSKLYQDPPADVTLRGGAVVPNLRKRLQQVTDAADQLGALDAAQDAAAASAAQAALYDGPQYDTVALMQANAAIATTGKILRAGPFRYSALPVVASSGDVLLTSGQWITAELDEHGRLPLGAFGLLMDGVTDDVIPLERAIESASARGVGLDWGTGDIFVSRQVGSQAKTLARIDWHYGDVKIILDPSASHQIAVLFYSIADAVHHSATGGTLHAYASQKANAGIILYQGDNSNTGSIYAEGLGGIDILRDIGFSYGTGVVVSGGFSKAHLVRPTAINIAMKVGAGVPSVVGVQGIAVTRGGAGERFPKHIVVDDMYINGVYSLDPAWAVDMDGGAFFGAEDTVARAYSYAEVHRPVVMGTWGRAIKFQIANADVYNPQITHNASATGGFTGPSIDFQNGDGQTHGGRYTYDGANVKYTSAIVFNSSEYMPHQRNRQMNGGNIIIKNGATLTFAVGNLLRIDTPYTALVADLKIDGTVTRLVKAQTGSTGSRLQVSRCHASRISAAGVLTESFGGTPYRRISVMVEDFTHDYLANVPMVDGSTGIYQTLSDLDQRGGCRGFTAKRMRDQDSSEQSGMGESRTLYPQGSTYSGTQRLLSYNMANNAIITLPAHGVQDGVFMFRVSLNWTRYGHAIFGVDNSAVELLTPGSTAWVAGTTSEPGTGQFRAWTDGSQVKLSNRCGSTRTIMIEMFG